MSEKPLAYHSVREVYRWRYPPDVVPAQTLGTLDSSSKNQFTNAIQILLHLDGPEGYEFLVKSEDITHCAESPGYEDGSRYTRLWLTDERCFRVAERPSEILEMLSPTIARRTPGMGESKPRRGIDIGRERGGQDN